MFTLSFCSFFTGDVGNINESTREAGIRPEAINGFTRFTDTDCGVEVLTLVDPPGNV